MFFWIYNSFEPLDNFLQIRLKKNLLEYLFYLIFQFFPPICYVMSKCLYYVMSRQKYNCILFQSIIDFCFCSTEEMEILYINVSSSVYPWLTTRKDIYSLDQGLCAFCIPFCDVCGIHCNTNVVT